MSKLIRVLIILVLLLMTNVLNSCKFDEKKLDNKIFFRKNKTYYDFFIEKNNKIFYTSPIYLQEIKKEKDLQTTIKKNTFNNAYIKYNKINLEATNKKYKIAISRKLSETNFIKNHLFEFDIDISTNGNTVTNIYYPEEYYGAYQFNIEEDDLLLINSLSNDLFNKKDSIKSNDTKGISNAIIINNKIITSSNYIFNNINTSLLIDYINLILFNKITQQSKKNTFYPIKSKVYINYNMPPKTHSKLK